MEDISKAIFGSKNMGPEAEALNRFWGLRAVGLLQKNFLLGNFFAVCRKYAKPKTPSVYG